MSGHTIRRKQEIVEKQKDVNGKSRKGKRNEIQKGGIANEI